MENLVKIKYIEGQLKTAPRSAIGALYRLIFEEVGDRKNRSKLREFSGFTFSDDSEEFKAKLIFASEFSVGDLTSICNILGLSYSANKEQLEQNIIRALMDINSLVDSNSEVDVEDDKDGIKDETNSENDERFSQLGEESVGNSDEITVRSEDDNDEPLCTRDIHSIRRSQPVNFSLGFKDVEDTIREFDGTDSLTIERWIADFEDAAILFEWTDLQKVVFAKRSLKGLAKLFIQSESGLVTWKKLKTALTKEFSIKVSSSRLHAMLAKRNIKESESVQEYFLVMRELASRGEIEAEALMDYVIEGLGDSTSNKAVLYDAKNLDEFKIKLKTYDRIRKSNTNVKVSSVKKKEVTDDKKTNFTKSKRPSCFNCGLSGHLSRDCKDKGKGPKCFKCNQYGHIATKCSENRVDLISSKKEIDCYKQIIVEDVNLQALVDTGSAFSLLREDIFEKLPIAHVNHSKCKAIGFGGTIVETKGSVQAEVVIDDEHYNLDLHIVHVEAMPMKCIIGRNILSLAEVRIDRDNVYIKKYDQDNFIGSITLADEIEIDVDPTEDISIGKEAKELLLNYKPNKTKTTDIILNINLKDNKPVYSRPRRLPIPEREVVERQVEKWIDDGIVEPCVSEFASPVVVTKKKDGSDRVCIDYRSINKLIEKDKYPIPLIEDLIDALKDSKIFSSLDLENGFFHVDVSKESQKYTAFVTHKGQYAFLKTPFGLCISPTVFQRFVNCVFRSLVNEGIVCVYFDDIIVLAKDETEAINNLKTVLKVASEYGLKINKKKCHLLKKRIEFLGQVIENGEIHPSPDKVLAVQNFPKPKSTKDVQSFLGLTGYFRKFINKYSLIAKPLSDLLRKDKEFQFDVKEQQSFNALKEVLIKKPVLKFFDRSHETELHTDACKDGIAAILLQRSPDDDKLHPTHYLSHKTSPAEQNYSSYDLEVLAIIYALQRLRVYLLGVFFKIVTDCSAFQQTMQKKEVSTKIWRWAQLLEDYSYVIEHRSGTRMQHVDALSRYPIMTINLDDVTARISKAQQSDEKLQEIIKSLESGSDNAYVIRNGLLYKFDNGDDLLVVPECMEDEIIRSAHQCGHFAAKRTEDVVRREYYIPSLTNKVKQLISNCVTCLVANRKEGRKEGFLHCIEKTDLPLHTYHVDHLGPLESTSKQYNHIFAVIDAFTKFVWLYPTKSTSTREVIDKLNRQKYIFGNPMRIISDRGTAFTSQEFQEYCDQEKIQHHRITTGLPRANGQIERINRVIIPALAKMSLDHPGKWYQHVNKVQQTLNSTLQRSIGMTPFKLLIGMEMRRSDDIKLKEILEYEWQRQFEKSREDLRQHAKLQIAKVHDENKKSYNLRRRAPKTFANGDLVAIKRTQMIPGRKLKTKFLGPYEITKVKLNDTYDVKRIGNGDGPLTTSTCAEYIKPWVSNIIRGE